MLNRVSQGQKTEAERYFLKAIQLDPTKGNCYMHYGKNKLVYLLFFFFEFDLSVHVFDRSLQLFNVSV